MNIGEAAKGSGVSAKMIRYYEASGLLPKAGRKGSGYRDYTEADVHRLRLVKRARDLGFSTDVIKALLALWSDKQRSNANARRLAANYIAELEMQGQRIHDMIAVLRHLIDACDRGDRPRYPIITEPGRGPHSKRTGGAARRDRSSKASRNPSE